MNRIFHPWHLWEDYQYNFHGGIADVADKDNTLKLYADMLRDLDKFEAALKVIIVDWKYSCEHNLTNEAMNRIAYLGQAACAYYFKVPNSLSMGGYNLLTDDEKIAADNMAQKYIDLWAANHKQLNKKVA